MGKLTLLFVLAAVVGGSMLSLSTRSLAGQAAQRRSEGQADQLARQIAETGRNLAIGAMMGANGFVDPAIGTRDYDGGRFQVVYTGAPDGQSATLEVTGTFGDATHTIRSQYQFDPLDFPAPIWLDAPYASSSVAGSPQILAGGLPSPIAFDGTLHGTLGLEPYLPFHLMDADFDGDLTPFGAWLDRPSASSWASLLEDLNVTDAEGLYQTALGVMGPADRLVPAAGAVLTVAGAQTWNGPTTITRVPAGLTIPSGASVSGQGVLIVEGAVDVQAGGSLTWTGLVIVRTGEENHQVLFNGTVTLTGALVLRQEPVAPVGHLDVTVWRSATGLTSPQGAHQAAPWSAGGGPYPWTQHSHRFDLEHADGRHVYFLESGAAGRHEAETQFHAAVADAGNEPVYLQFANEWYHGFGRYRLGIDGEGTFNGTVRWGFPGAIRGTGAHRTRVFPANDLDDLSIDLRALPALRARFDTEGGCDSWPFCIGGDWNRGGSLRLRLVRDADDATLYEAAFYWHMRQDEVDAHNAEVQAMRDHVASNAGFGTHLRLGGGARVAYSRTPLVLLSERLSFDGDELRLLGSTSSHQTATEARAAAPTP